MSSVKAYLELARWPNALMAVGGVVVGAAFGLFWPGYELDKGALPRVGVVCLAAIALTITANAWNDAADGEIDAVAHPTRPIPMGLIAPRAARRLALVSAGFAIGLCFLIAPGLGAITVGVVALMLAYSPWLKRITGVGNVVAAALGSLPFAYGVWASSRLLSSGAGLAIWAFPYQLAREIAKDLDDASGDAGHRMTIPLRWGELTARCLAVILLLVFFLLPFLLDMGLDRASIFFLAPAGLCVAWGAALIIRRMPGAPRLLKLGMLLAMIGVVLWTVFGPVDS